MSEKRPNLLANASMITGIAVIVLYSIAMCLGFIPFLNLFSMIIGPITYLLDAVALITGFLGYRLAKETGEGKTQAIVGMTIAGLHLAFVAFIMFASILLIVVGMFVYIALAILVAVLGG